MNNDKLDTLSKQINDYDEEAFEIDVDRFINKEISFNEICQEIKAEHEEYDLKDIQKHILEDARQKLLQKESPSKSR